MKSGIGNAAVMLCFLGGATSAMASGSIESVTIDFDPIDFASMSTVVMAENYSGTTYLVTTAARSADYLLNTCREGSVTSKVSPSKMDPISPSGELIGKLLNLSGESLRYEEIDTREAAVRLDLLEAPTHGKLILQPQHKGIVYYQYQAEPGYMGNDSLVFMAEFAGKYYKIVYNLIVDKGIDDNNPLCPPETPLIKLESKPASRSTGYNLNAIFITIADSTGDSIDQIFGWQL